MDGKEYSMPITNNKKLPFDFKDVKPVASISQQEAELPFSFEDVKPAKAEPIKQEPLPFDFSDVKPVTDAITTESVKSQKPTLVAGDRTGEITSKEIDKIIKRYGLGKQVKTINGKVPTTTYLQNLIEYHGSTVPDKEASIDTLSTRAAGFISDSALLGVPQLLVRKKINRDKKDTQGNWKAAVEEITQLARDRKTWLRMGAEVVGGVAMLGPIGIAGGVAKFISKAPTITSAILRSSVVAGVPGAIQGYALAKKGKEVEGALFTGAMGVLIGGTVGGIVKSGIAGKATDKIKQAAARTFIKQLGEEGAEDIDKVISNIVKRDKLKSDVVNKIIAKIPDPEFRAKVKTDDLVHSANLTPDELKLVKGTDGLISELDDFVKSTGKKSLQDLGREGDQVFLKNKYQTYLKRKAIPLAVAKAGLKNNISEQTLFQKAFYILSDQVPLSKVIDKKLGTNMESVISSLSIKHNLYTTGLINKLDTVKALNKITRKAKIKTEDLYEALNTGNKNNIDSKVFDDWTSFFNNERDLARTAGMPIPKLENYVPRKRLSTVKYTAAIKNKSEEIARKFDKKSVTELTDEQIQKVSKDDDFLDLFNEIKFVSGKKILNESDVRQVLTNMIERPGMTRSAMNIESFASKAREGRIPHFVREKDVGNLAKSWISSTHRTIAMRDGLEELRTIAQVAAKAGDTATEKHINNLVADIIGSRKDTLSSGIKAYSDRMTSRAQAAANKTDNRIYKNGLQFIADSPVLLNSMLQQVYPNYLGLNPKSALQNLASPVTGLIPDMGVGYGAKVYFQSYKDIANIITKGTTIKLSPEMAVKLNRTNPGKNFRAGELYKTKKIDDVVVNEGLIPGKWTGERMSDLEEGAKHALAKIGDSTPVRKYTDAMMYMFEKTEQMARANTFFMGKRLSNDMFNNPELAGKFLNKIDSPSFKRKINQSLIDGNKEETERLVIRYFNANNMFNYDRMNMSAYGRYMGPLFSVFSKWPTSIAGRLYGEFERKGLAGGTVAVGKTLLAPYLFLGLVDKVLMPDIEDSPRLKKIIGSKGLQGWTPLDAVIGMQHKGIEGLYSSPAFQVASTLKEGVETVFDKDRDTADALNRAIKKSYQTIGFGAGLHRFLTETAPQIIDDKD